MIFDLVAQVLTEIPKDELPTSWAVYIIGGLISFIGVLFVGIKWLVGLASQKVDKVVDRVESMHSAGISQLSTIRDSLIIQGQQIQETKTDIKEIKYAIQNIDCANEKIIQMKKRA